MKEKKTIRSSFDLQCFDGRNSSNQEEKFVYSTRSALQKVGIPPPLVYIHPKGCLAGFYKAACFDPTHCPNFGTGFRLGNEGYFDSCPS